jgi:hypothetical protein
MSSRIDETDAASYVDVAMRAGLRNSGWLRVRIAVTFTPDGGTPRTKSKAVTVNGSAARRPRLTAAPEPR